jgi:hypothetical protein
MADMDTRTGQIHEMQPGENLADLAKRTGALQEDLVELKHSPKPDCPKCHGKGSVPKKGQKPRSQFKRYEPCSCTQ